MKVFLKILLLVAIPAQLCAVKQNMRSIGALSFRVNGQLYTADSTHARGYAVKQTTVAYINGANDDMVIGIEWKGVKSAGSFSLNEKNGKVEFAISHKTYSIKQPGDYLKIVIKEAKQQGAFLLLNGTFEGQLQDKNGSKLQITEGRFETRSI